MTKPQVDYELVVYDELPEATPRGGGGGKSVLTEQLARISGGRAPLEFDRDSEWQEINGTKVRLWGRPIRIGLYSKPTACTAAKNVLQQRYGRTPAVAGWAFHNRRVTLPDEDGNVTEDSPTGRGLFATFTPDKIVQGAYEAHIKAEEKRKAELKAKREAEGDTDTDDLEDEVDDEELEDESEEDIEDEEENGEES